jgi:hypothetical protein
MCYDLGLICQLCREIGLPARLSADQCCMVATRLDLKILRSILGQFQKLPNQGQRIAAA